MKKWSGVFFKTAALKQKEQRERGKIMRKKSTRLLSAALAACMMLSVLPVGAFAAEPGTEPENTATAQEEVHILNKTGDSITTGGTYTMESGPYTGQITVNVEDGGDVIINITGDVTTNIETALINVVKGHVTINGGTATVENTREGFTSDIGYALICLSSEDANTKVEINGGTYKTKSGAAVGCDYFEKGTLTINSGTFETKKGGAVENYADKSAVMQIEDGTFIGLEPVESNWNSNALLSRGTTIINGGNFSSVGGYCIVNEGYGDLYIHDGTFEGCSRAVCNPEGTSDSTLTITGGDFKATPWGGTETNVLFVGTGTLNVTGGSFEGTGKLVNAILTEASSATIENVTLTVNASDKGAGICTRDGSKYPEVKNVTFKHTGSADDYGDLRLYNVQPGTYEFNLTEDFAPMAVISAENVSEETKVTKKTNSHYQKDLKLVSAKPDYIIDYKKNDDGTEYRYFNTRKQGEYYVNPIHATMAVEGVDVRPYSQFMPGTQVTLNAFSNEGGKQFTRWKVEKIAADGVTEVYDLHDVLVPNSENPETATLIVPDYDVFVTAVYENEIVDPGTGGDAAGNIQGALSAVVVGAAAGAIIYEAGTGIYRVINMPGIPMPSNRIELAELLWERADKPEPVSTALYSDIDEDDTDAQKAAHWAVEQDLMKDDADNNKFNPHFPVSKLRVCTTWEKAKQKGLFDKTEE